MPRFSMIEPARSCLKKIRLSFPQNGIFALFDSTYFWRVFFGVLCFQQKLFFFSAFVLLRIEKGAVAELSVLLQLLIQEYSKILLNKHRLYAERGLPSPLCALPMQLYALPIALSTVCNARLRRTFRHSFREMCFLRRTCRRRKLTIFLFSLRRKNSARLCLQSALPGHCRGVFFFSLFTQ